jgi:hypothetical protein
LAFDWNLFKSKTGDMPGKVAVDREMTARPDKQRFLASEVGFISTRTDAASAALTDELQSVELLNPGSPGEFRFTDRDDSHET